MYTYTMMENTMDTSLRMIKLNKITYSHIVAYQYEFSVSFLRFVIPDWCAVHEEYFHDRGISVVFKTFL